jgi:hypothetical protein
MANKPFHLISVLCALMLASCSSGMADLNQQPSSTPLPPTNTPEPMETITPTITPTPTNTPVVILDADPVVVEFTAEDGTTLTGIYYPPDANPAPVIVLMHWAKGDQAEWREVALWLQGRGELERTPDYNHSWKSSTWYPELALDRPLGVFTFNFRQCGEEGCQAYLPGDWLMDARAGIRAALDLHGADTNMVLTAGASIGADGAVDSCAWLNTSDLGSCLGSFAISPASLLTEPFDLAAGELLAHDPPLPVYCLYTLRDDASVETCGGLPGLTAVDYGYVEYHGMEVLQPDRTPNPLDLLQTFINFALSGEQ